MQKTVLGLYKRKYFIWAQGKEIYNWVKYKFTELRLKIQEKKIHFMFDIK